MSPQRLHFTKSNKPEWCSRRRGANSNLNRNGAARAGATAAIAGHPAGAGASPAAVIAVIPAGAHAGDPARSVAAGASGRPARTHHGVVIHHLFDENCPCQYAEAGGQLG